MDWKRIFRILVCLVLVCCLLVQVSPIQAKAILPESIAVGAGIVIGSVLLGLGVGMAADSTSEVLTDMVVSCRDFLTLNYNFVSDDEKIQVWSNVSADIPYMVDQSLIDAIREWFFEKYSVDTETGHVCAKSDVENPPEGYLYYGYACLPDISLISTINDYPYRFIAYLPERSSYSLVISEVPFTLNDTGTSVSVLPRSEIHMCLSSGTGWNLTSRESKYSYGYVISDQQLIVWTSHDIMDSSGEMYFPATPPLSSDGEYLFTSTGYIAASSIPLDEAYAEWAAGAVTIPGETEDKPYITGYPVGLAPSLEETLGLTQSDVWQGVSTYEQTGGEITDPDDGNDDTGGMTLADVTVTTFVSKLLADLTKGLFGNGPQNLTDLFGSQWIELQTELRSMQSSLTQALSDLGTYIQSLPESFSDFFTQTWEKLQTHFSNLTQTLTDILTKIQTEFQTLAQTLTDALTNLKTDLLQGVKDLFLPHDGYIDQKIDGLTSKYEFANQIATTGKNLEFWLLNLGQQPPIIYIDLGATRGSYNIGQKTVLMDLTWYEEYKPTMDTIMSAFLWLWFIWRMLLSLPGIIQGTSGFWTKIDSSAGAGTWERPASRLNSGDDIKQLGTSNYHSPGSGGRHYIKHD